jgi:death-on-curing protein
MIDLETAIYAHGVLIDDFGGSKGVRDLGGLEAALARPYATFDQQELYPTPVNKASVIFESLILCLLNTTLILKHRRWKSMK